jgi:hypothetical protein
MALQGTLDTFQLPDVLRLLASTRKSGRLHLSGDRGDGDVWLVEGRVVGAGTDGATAVELGDTVFELLRARAGTFSFEPGASAPGPAVPTDVEPLLTAVEAQLDEWRAIEAVVPSLDARVTLAPALPSAEVTVDARTWELVTAIGSGLSVAELGGELDLGEIAVSRIVHDLVVRGLASVDERPAPVHAVVAPTASAGVAPAGSLAVERRTSLFGGAETTPPTDGPLGASGPLLAQSRLDAALDRVADRAEAGEVARQLAMLSPAAAEAVATAAVSDSDADRQAAMDAVDEGDEPINRTLLLKFLGSVKS